MGCPVHPGTPFMETPTLFGIYPIIVSHIVTYPVVAGDIYPQTIHISMLYQSSHVPHDIP